MNTSPTDRPDSGGRSADFATVARGNIYLTRQQCESHLAGAQSIALVAREDRILIVPLTRESGGGMLLKIRNPGGDRVIHAQEFFRDKGFVEDFRERSVPMAWNGDSAALELSSVPRRPKDL